MPTTTTRPTHSNTQEDEVQELPTERPDGAQELLDATEDLLDEIDAILEQNAATVHQEKPTKTIKFSNLIREGAKKGPQIYGWGNELTGESCALGAAYLAAKDHGLV